MKKTTMKKALVHELYSKYQLGSGTRTTLTTR